MARADPPPLDLPGEALAALVAPQGAGLLEALVAGLARACGAHLALVVEVDGSRGRTLAASDAKPHGADGWELAGTVFEALEDGEPRRVERDLARAYPRDPWTGGPTLESCVVHPLRDADGTLLGHLALFDARPLEADPRRDALLAVLAARAAAELARRRVERTLGESEERFRDLFDEAPIAYVHEDLESRFLRANRAALRILGVAPEDAVGTIGMSLVADTAEAQRSVREAFASVGRGTDTSGVVLEMRRKDDGRPVWIEWWSRPDPGGQYTRTMFVDITQRVLLEREQRRLREQNRYLREEIQSVHNFREIVGRSPALVEVLESVRRVAATDTTVLITGETGTGKELVARALHSLSPRHDRPLIKLNCAALPTGLVESELFGHEKGAFSGALSRRIGRFELAQGGTIFLDEIGEVSLDVQVKLLRVLQEREFERVGGSAPIQADVRVLAATNRDLPRAVREGKFREDLYYRLCVFPLHLPPLRERREDVPLLVQYFLAQSSARVGKRIDAVDPELMERLTGYAWPGNVRELQNVLERAVILANGDVLDLEAAPLLAAPPELASAGAPATDGAPGDPEPGSLEEVERRHVLATLERVGWVIEGPSGAARRLGLHPNTLRSRMKRLGIARAARGPATGPGS